MIDFVLGIAMAALALRGWLRGMVREALDLAGLLIGVWAAFTLSIPLGDFLSDSFGLSSGPARVAAGVLLFLLLSALLAVGAHYLSRMMSLPGLTLVNRAGGALVALGWGLLLILLAVNVLRVLPVPQGLERSVEESTVVQAVAGPDAAPQRAFRTLLRDEVVVVLSGLQDLFGGDAAVPEGTEVLSFPPAPADETRQVRGEAGLVLEAVNDHRLASDLAPLVLSAALQRVAEERAGRMYELGRLSRETPPGRFVSNDIADAGVAIESSGEALALAATWRSAVEGILESGSGRGELSRATYDRAGVAVVDGPTGRLVVVVLAG